MDLQATTIVEAIQDAPGWVCVGITAPTAEMRDCATEELASRIARRLEQPVVVAPVDQFRPSI
ncbi:DUF6771 family protein [Sphingomonas sp. CJ20]